MSHFTEADIRAGANSQIFQRGADYYRSAAVTDVVQRGNVITAKVAGSDYQPYQVFVTLAADGSIADATCTCPYDWGGYCKHIVAVLLTVQNKASAVSVKPALDALLAGLTDAQLRRIMANLAEDQPSLVAAIEEEIKWLKTDATAATDAAASSTEQAMTVDIGAIRRIMHKEFRAIISGVEDDADHYWDDDVTSFDPYQALEPHLDTARALLAAGDAPAATRVITVVIEEWGNGLGTLDEWIYESNEDVIDDATETLASMLAEALLSQDLSPQQRQEWQGRIDAWADDVVWLEIADIALTQWWDYPPLVAAMQGSASAPDTEEDEEEDEAPMFPHTLTQVRLAILERQGRTQEYIHLAKATGQLSAYVNMLARTGQVAQAIAEARQHISSPAAILSLAQVLVELGHRAEAAEIAAHGFDLPAEVNKVHLARWTLALAQQTDDPALALRAAQVAFLSSFELADYKVVEQLAGNEWPAIKRHLLEQLEKSPAYHKLDIYLYEHMLAQAMAYVDRGNFYGDLDRVVQATRAEFPDWGIGKCKKQAEHIMDAGKANAYDHAVAWLRTVRDIYLEHQRQAEWRAYRDSLLGLHARKYKLVPMLRALG